MEEKGVKGKILTGDYLNFTQPKALRRLLKYKNIELKILSNEKFHAKGYFFRKGDVWSMIIGSSNLTQTALTVNFEWNLKINSLEKGKSAKEILNNFFDIFNRLPKTDLKMVEEYEKIYKAVKEYEKEKIKKQNYFERKEITPNLMQREALKNLFELRKTKDRGILISATGTGKTYLSAFDVKNVNPEKMLFTAHRKTILEKSKLTFENIIKDKKMAVYGENGWENADYIFAMVQTLSRPEHLKNFSEDFFDYIIIDEVHHSGAKTYQALINYFKPKFLLGMTATPERTDDFDVYGLFNHNIAYEIRLYDALRENLLCPFHYPKFLLGMTATPERTDDFDVYGLFNHNIAYEIRLYDALRENLLCPFHYFGISDISVDGEIIDEKTSIKKLAADERVNHLL